jgi:hypothetical protein
MSSTAADNMFERLIEIKGICHAAGAQDVLTIERHANPALPTLARWLPERRPLGRRPDHFGAVLGRADQPAT